MAFQQLYYTSCEHGLAGYGGYQFNAVTPGVPPAVMREVEERTLYEPPAWLLARPGPAEPEEYPIAFLHATSEATGMAITARAVFAGADYSGRPGNYFAHALTTATPELDFGALLPVELWEAGLWQSRPVDRTELPELPGPPPRGVIDRPAVQAFLDARGGEDILPGLLTAVGRAMAGDRPVLIVSGDATENVWWIAAVSFLLGEHLGRRMTFTTYSHRPGYARYHLTGILADALPPNADTSFQLFDLAAGRTPADEAHPLAAMLASTGVMAAPGLWRQATAFASGAETSLDDWLPPVAAAAGLLGRALSPADTDVVARWIAGAVGRMPADLADVVLGVPLAQPGDTLTDERLLSLRDLARELPAPDRAEYLEALLVGRAVAHIARGEPALPVRLASPSAATAQSQAVQVLQTATPATALAVLQWAAASGLELPDSELLRYGHTRLDPSTPSPELPEIVHASPAILRGLLARLAEEPPEVAGTLLAQSSAAITRADLAAYPGLTELWLRQSAARGAMEPLRAFDEIVDVRDRAQRLPRVDGQLLRALWPSGCPPDHIAELLSAVTDQPAPDVLEWFTAEIRRVTARGVVNDEALRLAQVLADHPLLALLPEADGRILRNTARAEPLLRRAWAEVPQGNLDIFHQLFAMYLEADGEIRYLLGRHLPRLLARAEPLGPALHGCPGDVAVAFGLDLGRRLAPEQPNVALAGRVFAALADPDVAAQPTLTEPLTGALEQLRAWHRRDLGTLARALKKDDDLTQRFQTWRGQRRGWLARKLPGGDPGLRADKR
jgi:hypothetical protein